MTQANNRQGGGGTKAPGDGDRPGPGTESNRARAARGGPGPDVLSVYLDGQRIAGAPMDRVEVGIDHASGPDFTATQRVVVTPDGQRHAVNAPSQADLDGAKRAAPAQPDPAPGQVWAPPVGAVPSWVDVDGTVTIASDNTLDVPGLLWLVHGGTIVAGDLDGWTCIGVATPHGRVAVGDAFGPRYEPGADMTVQAIGAGDSVLLRGARGWEQWSDASGLLEGGWTRTRYAPARAGERLRWRAGGRPIEVIDAETAGCVADPAQWERLDPGHPAPQTLASDLSAHEIIMDWIVSAEGIGHASGGVFTDCGRDGLTAIGLAAPARDLRALFDAIGRALELPATRHACPFGAGLTVTVLRDEMLFTPTAETGIGTADLAGDARGLAQLRAAVQEAMVTGAASLPQWGAKGPRVEVRREGGAMVAPVEAEPCEAPRYTPANGGADAWQWGVGE